MTSEGRAWLNARNIADQLWAEYLERSLRDEVCSTCDGEGEIQGEPVRDPEDDGMRICPTCDGEVRTSPESATEHARRIAG